MEGQLGLEKLSSGVSAICPTGELLSLERPDPRGTATPVAVGVFLRDLSSIDDVRQTLTADITFVLRWRDHRLADAARGDSYSLCPLSFEDLWKPVLEFQNSRSVQKFHREITAIDAQGVIIDAQRLLMEVSTPFDLRDFPFDTQLLTIVLEPLFSGVGELQLFELKELIARRDELTVAGWEIDSIGARVTRTRGELRKADYDRFEFLIEARRDGSFYLRKLFAPLMLIVFMSWAVFWLPPNLLAPQVGLAATSMLTLIAHQFYLSNLLPRISYATRADSFVLWSSLLVFLALVEAIATGALGQGGKEELAVRIDRTARWLFPAVFAIIIVQAMW